MENMDGIRYVILIHLLFQLVQSNKKDCARLASRAAELTQLISKEVHAREGLVDEDIRSAIASMDRFACRF